MHESVMAFLRRAVLPEDACGSSVLEIGSLDVNGSPRDVIMPLKPASYVGTDIQHGRGVDRVMNASRLVEVFGQDRFDLVVSTEMLEHAADWKGAVRAMKAVLKPRGKLVLTARGPDFPRHDCPDDYWRFTRFDFGLIFSDMNIILLEADPDLPGVFLKASKPDPFREADIEHVSVRRAP